MIFITKLRSRCCFHQGCCFQFRSSTICLESSGQIFLLLCTWWPVLVSIPIQKYLGTPERASVYFDMAATIYCLLHPKFIPWQPITPRLRRALKDTTTMCRKSKFNFVHFLLVLTPLLFYSPPPARQRHSQSASSSTNTVSLCDIIWMASWFHSRPSSSTLHPSWVPQRHC